MRKVFLAALLLFANFAPLSAFRAAGQYSSYYYLFQDRTVSDSSLNHIRQYQSLSLLLADFGRVGKSRGFQVAASVRIRSDLLRGPQKKLQPNFYNLYLGYEYLFGMLDWRVGRQFIAFPILGTNADAAMLRFRPVRKLELFGFYGASVNPLFPDRVGPVKENQTWGASATAFTSPYFKLKTGWGARFFNGRNRFRGGFAEFSFLHRGWNFYGKGVYDQRTEGLVAGIFRLGLPTVKKLSTQLEAANYKPVFYQNSIFPRFALKRYTDLRASFDYPLSEKLGLFGEEGLIVFEDQTGYRLEVGLRADPILFGYRRTGGLGRSYDGVFSQTNYHKGDFTFTGAFDLSQFRLSPDSASSVDEDSRVANLLLGVGWQPYRPLLVEATYQVLSNPGFRYDNRLFLRGSWRFDIKR